MNITLSDFVLLTLSVFIGTLAAVAVAAYIGKGEAEKALAEARANNPLAKLGFF